MPVYLNALEGKGVMVITTTIWQLDAEEMGQAPNASWAWLLEFPLKQSEDEELDPEVKRDLPVRMSFVWPPSLGLTI